MFVQTLSIWRRNFIVFIGFAALVLMTEKLTSFGWPGSTVIGALGLAQLYVGFLVQRSVLFDTPFLAKTPPEAGGQLQYFLKALVLSLLTLGATFITFILTIRAGQRLNGTGGSLLSMLIFICFFLLVKILLGTWLPASLTKKNSSLGEAFGRGIRGFGRLFFQGIGIGCASVVGTVVVVVASIFILHARAADIQVTNPNVISVDLVLVALNNLFFASMFEVLLAREVKDRDNNPSITAAFEVPRSGVPVLNSGVSVTKASQAPSRNIGARAQFGRRI